MFHVMSGKGWGSFWSLDSICTAVLRKTQLRLKELSRLGTKLHRSGNHTILLLFDAVAVRLTKQSWGLSELICYLFNLDDWLHEKVHGTLIVLCRGFQKYSLELTVEMSQLKCQQHLHIGSQLFSSGLSDSSLGMKIRLVSNLDKWILIYSKTLVAE